jgi:hypothetical protein
MIQSKQPIQHKSTNSIQLYMNSGNADIYMNGTIYKVVVCSSLRNY